MIRASTSVLAALAALVLAACGGGDDDSDTTTTVVEPPTPPVIETAPPPSGGDLKLTPPDGSGPPNGEPSRPARPTLLNRIDGVWTGTVHIDRPENRQDLAVKLDIDTENVTSNGDRMGSAAAGLSAPDQCFISLFLVRVAERSVLVEGRLNEADSDPACTEDRRPSRLTPKGRLLLRYTVPGVGDRGTFVRER